MTGVRTGVRAQSSVLAELRRIPAVASAALVATGHQLRGGPCDQVRGARAARSGGARAARSGGSRVTRSGGAYVPGLAGSPLGVGLHRAPRSLSSLWVQRQAFSVARPGGPGWPEPAAADRPPAGAAALGPCGMEAAEPTPTGSAPDSGSGFWKGRGRTRPGLGASASSPRSIFRLGLGARRPCRADQARAGP